MITIIGLFFSYNNVAALINSNKFLTLNPTTFVSPLNSSYFDFFLSLFFSAAPYSLRNLSDSTLTQYELDSKFRYLSASQKHTYKHNNSICKQIRLKKPNQNYFPFESQFFSQVPGFLE